MQNTIQGLTYRNFQQLGGILQQKEMRPARSIDFVFDEFTVLENGDFNQQKKKSSFALQSENLLFLDKDWTLVSPNGQMCYQQKYWALDSFSFPYPTEFETYLPKESQKKEHLNGLVFVFTNVGFANYYHVLTELLPRLEFISALKGKLKLAVAEDSPNYVWQALNNLGFTHEDIYQIKKGISYSADTWLTMPWGLNFIPERFQFLKNQFKTKSTEKKRVYISRKNQAQRRIINEESLIPILQKHNFEIVEAEKLSFLEQVELFRNSEIICGSHGAGLANSIWMENPRLIEIRPSGFQNDCYKHLALSLGAKQITTIETSVIDSSQNMEIQADYLDFLLSDMLN